MLKSVLNIHYVSALCLCISMILACSGMETSSTTLTPTAVTPPAALEPGMIVVTSNAVDPKLLISPVNQGYAWEREPGKIQVMLANYVLPTDPLVLDEAVPTDDGQLRVAFVLQSIDGTPLIPGTYVMGAATTDLRLGNVAVMYNFPTSNGTIKWIDNIDSMVEVNQVTDGNLSVVIKINDGTNSIQGTIIIPRLGASVQSATTASEHHGFSKDETTGADNDQVVSAGESDDPSTGSVRTTLSSMVARKKLSAKVYAIVMSNKGIRTCFIKEFKETVSFPKDLVLRLHIMPDGKASSAQLTKPTGRAIDNCLSAAGLAISYPKFEGNAIDEDVPLKLPS